MSEASLSKLDPEKQAALNDEQKAIFCLMHPSDQDFFAKSFSPKDLLKAIDRKGVIMKVREQQAMEFEALLKSIALYRPPALPASGIGLGQIGAVIAGTAGLAAAGAVIATDSTAQWVGIEPDELVAPLETEFGDKERTDFDVTGSPDALEGTVYMISGRQYVPALTVNLTKVKDGIQVNVSDLTQEGMLEAVKRGGTSLLRMAGKGLSLLFNVRGGIARGDRVLQDAQDLFADGTSIAGLAHDLQLKQRAWGAIKTTADSIEKARKEEQARQREARYALQAAWDRYYNCPKCSVPFAESAEACAVCGTERPEKPVRPDPRMAPEG